MKIYQAIQTLLVGDTQTDSHFGMIEVTFNAISTIQNFIQIHQPVQNVHPPQKFKVRHYGIVKVTRLKNMASRSLSMSSPPYKISSKSTNQFEIYQGVSLHPSQKFKRPLY
jgi:hypothetical protein